jgi:UDP-N-acetylmuramyl pentapeptide phosphotransferase/UDP-N-acetylglucosamine-1-phosphate transferase
MNLTFVLQILGVGFLALVLSYLGVAVLRRWAERRQILDIPNERSSHSLPIPRGGGIAIVFFSLIGFIVIWQFNPIWPFSVFLTYLVGSLIIAGVSWLDDLCSLPNRIRFSAHTIVSLLLLIGVGYWNVVNLPLVGQLHLGWVGVPITLLWITGFTNAYNFMDGIDGIAGGQAVVAGLGWAFLGWLNHLPLISTLGLLLASCSLGFLGHNWPPARIFMGDVGSVFLGYTFAILAVIAAQKDPRLALAGVLLVWPFIFDTTFTFLRRLRRGENVFTAHRSHLYQRLVTAGYSHRFVTLLYIGLSGTGAILALTWTLNLSGATIIVTLSLPLLCLVLWAFVVFQERICPTPLNS